MPLLFGYLQTKTIMLVSKDTKRDALAFPGQAK